MRLLSHYANAYLWHTAGLVGCALRCCCAQSSCIVYRVLLCSLNMCLEMPENGGTAPLKKIVLQRVCANLSADRDSCDILRLIELHRPAIGASHTSIEIETATTDAV